MRLRWVALVHVAAGGFGFATLQADVVAAMAKAGQRRQAARREDDRARVERALCPGEQRSARREPHAR